MIISNWMYIYIYMLYIYITCIYLTHIFTLTHIISQLLNLRRFGAYFSAESGESHPKKAPNPRILSGKFYGNPRILSWFYKIYIF